METHSKIAIVGAGPVGAVLAMMLSKQGYSVHVFEKRKDPTLGDTPAGRSVNLSLSRRAINAFDILGIKEKILAHGIKMYGRTSHNLDGTHFHQYGKQTDHNFSISRNLLNNLLIECAKEV